MALSALMVRQSPIDFTVIEGLRNEARQRELVDSGASQTMNSRHLTGHAIDVMAIDPATGKGGFEHFGWYRQISETVKRIAREEGVPITWGGDWKTLVDGPHYQLDWDAYPKDEKFTPTPVSTAHRAATAAGENKTTITGAVMALSGTAGSLAADASNAPPIIQYAIAAVIMLGAMALIYDKVIRK